MSQPFRIGDVVACSCGCKTFAVICAVRKDFLYCLTKGSGEEHSVAIDDAQEHFRHLYNARAEGLSFDHAFDKIEVYAVREKLLANRFSLDGGTFTID